MLDGALAELAKQLGVGVGELWGFLRDGGLDSYARMQVVTSMPWAIAGAILTVACIVGAVVSAKRHAGACNDNWDVAFWTFCILGALAAILTSRGFSTLLGWLVEPQGMLIDMFMSKI